MSMLNRVTHTSKAQSGIKVVIAGVEKVGKTTLTCSAPRPLLIPFEHGYQGVNVNMTPQPDNFDQSMDLLDEIIDTCKAGKFIYKTLVVDSATAVERLIHDATVQLDPGYSPGNKKTVTMDSALGGYGKAYQYANGLFAEFLAKCDILTNNAGINIVFTSHVFAGKVIDPAFGEYDTWDILLHSPKNNKTYGKREMITQWADIVGFLHEPIIVTKTKDSDLSKGINANKGRILGVERTPGYVAGNRFGIKGEISVPLVNSWNYLAKAIYDAAGVDVYNRDV